MFFISKEKDAFTPGPQSVSISRCLRPNVQNFPKKHIDSYKVIALDHHSCGGNELDMLTLIYILMLFVVKIESFKQATVQFPWRHLRA